MGHTAIFAGQGQKQMLAADQFALELTGLFDGTGHDISKMRRTRETAKDPGVFEAALDQLVDRLLGAGEIDTHLVENVGSDSLPILQNGEKEVFGPDVVLLIIARDLLRDLDDTLHSRG